MEQSGKGIDRPGLSFWFASIVCRLWMTVTLFVFGVLWAEKTVVLVLMVSGGVFMDAIRNKTNPMLQFSCKEVMESYIYMTSNSKLQNNTDVRTRLKEYILFLLIPILSVIIVFVYSFVDYFGYNFNYNDVSSVYLLVSPFFEPLRRHVGILNEVGNGSGDSLLYSYTALK
jgi:hypothetical protein